MKWAKTVGGFIWVVSYLVMLVFIGGKSQDG